MSAITRFDVLHQLQNQTLNIRGLYPAFAGWSFKVNPYVEEARQDVNQMLTR